MGIGQMASFSMRRLLRQGRLRQDWWRRGVWRLDRAAAAVSSAVAAPARLCHPITFHPDFALNPVPEGHRFPMPKDELLYRCLQQHGLAGRTFICEPADEATLCLAHDPLYVRSFLAGSIAGTPAMRQIGLEWSPQLLQRTLVGVGSAVLAARLAVEFGVACMTNGGTHHAHYAHGSGWCIFNDLAVAARAAQRDAGVGAVLFVDLDVHAGDGTATIFAGDPSVTTFSMHCVAQSFPRHVPPSDVDIALPAGTGDAEYLAALAQVLPGLIERVQPDLVLYNAGTDVAAGDTLGKMALTLDGIRARDHYVLRTCAEARVPVAAAIGGGYSPDHAQLVLRHMCLHQAAAELLPELSLGGRAARVARPRAG